MCASCLKKRKKNLIFGYRNIQKQKELFIKIENCHNGENYGWFTLPAEIACDEKRKTSTRS